MKVRKHTKGGLIVLAFSQRIFFSESLNKIEVRKRTKGGLIVFAYHLMRKLKLNIGKSYQHK